MIDVRKIIREAIEDYISQDEGIRAVLFDFDMTLFDTTCLVGIDQELIRSTNDISSISHLINKVKIYDGIDEMLSYLRNHNIAYGIVSNRNEAIIKAVVGKYGLKPQIIVGERLNCPKGIRMKEALRKLAVEPKNALYVGDSTSDNAEARKSGIDFVGASWGGKTLPMAYNSPSELIKYIEYINS